MMSAIAAVSARDGLRCVVGQLEGQPVSYCGQSPCSTQPRSRSSSHCGEPRASPSSAHHVGDQDSEST
jgi:hypothetical protein